MIRSAYHFRTFAMGLGLIIGMMVTAPLNAQSETSQRGYFDGSQSTLAPAQVGTSDRLEYQSGNLYRSVDEPHPCLTNSFDTTMPCEASQGRGLSLRLEEFNTYPTFSFLGDQVGNYCEFEFASKTKWAGLEMENRTVMNVADLPDTIKLGPTNPGSESPPTGRRASGFGDVLSGFFFSRRDLPRNYHLGIGPVMTFPTATDGLLGSSQFTIGPGAHFSTEIGRMTTGFFVWQSWGVTDNSSKKQVNQLFGKPFFIYDLSEKWNLIYIPLGMSHSWKASAGDDWTVPIGGGVRRLFQIGGQKMGLQVQAFDYVARKPQDPEWEMRFTIEFLFD